MYRTDHSTSRAARVPAGVERLARRAAAGGDESDASASVAAAIAHEFDSWPSAATVGTLPPIDDGMPSVFNRIGHPTPGAPRRGPHHVTRDLGHWSEACCRGTLSVEVQKMDVHERPVGLSVWELELYDALLEHISAESDLLARYEGLAAEVPAHVRFLLELIAEDEARHHSIYEQWAKPSGISASSSNRTTACPT